MRASPQKRRHSATSADIKEFARTDEMRKALQRALRQLEKARFSKAELADAVFQAAKTAAEGLEIPPVPIPKARGVTGTPESAIALLSDWQLGKLTPTYNSAICARRMDEYAEAVEVFVEMHRKARPVRDLRVYLLGDLVEGELIFPGQAWRLDASLYSQVVERGPLILCAFLRRMAATFQSVQVVTVIGNHGAMGARSRRDMHPESNADAMLYEISKMLLKDEPRITWAGNVERNERKWFAVDTIGKHRYFMFHGDQIQGSFVGGFSWYGFGRALMGWSTTPDIGPFQYSFSGHYHTPVRFKAGFITHWGNGTTESSNTYALEKLKVQGVPSQWLFFAHPTRGIVAEHEIRLN